MKGYEHSNGEYVLLEPKELERLCIPTKRAIRDSAYQRMEQGQNPEEILNVLRHPSATLRADSKVVP